MKNDVIKQHDNSYKGLYGGLGAEGIHSQKGWTKNQKILDHMGSIELAANLLSIDMIVRELKTKIVLEK